MGKGKSSIVVWAVAGMISATVDTKRSCCHWRQLNYNGRRLGAEARVSADNGKHKTSAGTWHIPELTTNVGQEIKESRACTDVTCKTVTLQQSAQTAFWPANVAPP